MSDLTPVKISLVADLVEVINENIGALLRATVVACPDCRTQEEEEEAHSEGCATCKGIGAIERYVIDMNAVKSQRFGRLVEGFEFKGGQIVPKFRSKDKAFAMLIKLLGLDKAVVELANAATFTESLSAEQRDTYIEQLKELASMGVLDGRRARD